nr:EamA family transporter [uncultured Peptostreptococcus sp.]
MRPTSKTVGVSMMTLATFFWGYMGVSSRFLNQISLRSVDISFIRSLSAAIMLTIFLFFTNRSAFRLPVKGLLFACFYGALCFAIGMSFYSLSVDNIPISIATVLMFSNPIWASLFGRIFFGDAISRKKLVIMLACLIGCMCIIDVFSAKGAQLNMIGVLAGILNGMTFSLQIVLPRFVERNISKDSLLLYGFWAATICLAFFVDIGDIGTKLAGSDRPIFYLTNLLAIGILCTFVAISLYVKSTKYIGTSLPSMMSALEPVFASIIAFLVFGEVIKPIQILGAVIIISSVVALEVDLKRFLNSYKLRHSI